MLARTPTTLVYLSAAELKITDRERAGLIEVRDDLASGRVKHSLSARGGSRKNDPQTDRFSMIYWNGHDDCGTVHCIGGFMQARRHFGRQGYSLPLGSLFYPNDDGSYERGPETAVRAIDHFLAGAGAECWPMALQDVPAV